MPETINNGAVVVDVVVVGAGISGLLLAWQLGRRGRSVVVLEARSDIGGRMQTRDKTDTGAWRIPNTHQKIQRLAKTLDIQLEPTYSSRQSVAAKKKNAWNIKNSNGSNNSNDGLSVRDTLLTTCPVKDVVDMELATGYPGALSGQKRTYSTSKKVRQFLVPAENGMQTFCDKLLEKALDTGNVRVQCSTRVYRVWKVDRARTYLVKASKRKQQQFTKQKFQCSSVVLACQPFNFPPTNFNVHLQPVINSVGTLALCHVYIRTKSFIEPFHEISDDVLGQLVAIGPHCLMVYVSGPLAEFHNNRHTHDRERYVQDLSAWIRDYDIDVDIEAGDVSVFYWQHAVSFWRPNAAGDALVDECVVPHPVELPGVVCVGEQFSTNQGWAEGALESSHVALDYLLSNKAPIKQFKTLPKNCMVYDGRVVDVSDWISKHPGGKQALMNHMHDRDVAHVWRTVHNHAPYALAHLLSLQIGFMAQ